jgi:hypothetical protein
MKRFLILFFTFTTCLVAANVFAGGKVDKATGDYVHGNCWDCVPGDELPFISHKLMSAHEASGKHRQKGFVFSWNLKGKWFEMDLSDTDNTCVKIYEDGRVRTGGLVSEGNGPQVGRYFGLELEDNGEPAYFVDRGTTVRFSTEYYFEPARLAFLEWCETGNIPPEGEVPEGFTIWKHVIFEGNLQVHNSPRDGD